MDKKTTQIAGLPPYERGYDYMGYLKKIPELKVVENIAHLPSYYLPAVELLEEERCSEFVVRFQPNERWRVLYQFSEDKLYESIADFRKIRAVAAVVGQKLPIACWVTSIEAYLYALIAQADELLCDEAHKELASAANRMLIENSLVGRSIDVFYTI